MGFLTTTFSNGEYIKQLQQRIKELEAENDSIKKWLNDKLEEYDFSDFVKDIEKSVLRIKKVKSERDKLQQQFELLGKQDDAKFLKIKQLEAENIKYSKGMFENCSLRQRIEELEKGKDDAIIFCQKFEEERNDFQQENQRLKEAVIFTMNKLEKMRGITMKRCERCNELLILIDTCNCIAFKIESEDGDIHERYAATAEGAALSYAEWTNVHGDYHLVNSEEVIKVNGTEYVISAEPDIHYSATKL